MTNGEKYKTAQERETVRDVCAEIKTQRYQTSFPAEKVLEWRDRILAAHEREMRDEEVSDGE